MMSIKEQINAILNKKMDRKDFLKHVAVGVVAVMGFGAILRAISARQSQINASGIKKSSGSRDGQ